MINATGLELRAGARILLGEATLRVQPGDRIGLVGRNGAGKTTTLKVLAGEGTPVRRRGRAPRPGRLPAAGPPHRRPRRHRPRPGALRPRPGLPAGRDEEARGGAGRGPDATRGCAATARSRTGSPGWAGTPPRPRPPASAPTSACPTGCWSSRCGTLSGGQRRRIELARILFRDASETGGGTLLLDEPTNHLDADSITWLRGFLASHKGGLIVISHDGGLLESVVNKVWYLDANRATVDVYNLGWKAYLEQRETDERRRRRERANAEKKAGALMAQADKMRAKATKTVAAQNMARRAERMLAGLEDVRAADKVAKVRFPSPAACGKTPLTAKALSKSYGSLEIFCDVDVAVDRGSRVAILGLNGAGQDHAAADAGRPARARHRRGAAGARAAAGLLRAGARDPRRRPDDPGAHALSAHPDQTDTDLRKILGAFLFSGDDVDKPAGVLSGGEKTRLALATLVCSGANVLLLDEPTNNLDPISREQVLDAIARYPGAIVLVTHDPGAVQALKPDRAILLPDGVEDAWSDDLLELVELA